MQFRLHSACRSCPVLLAVLLEVLLAVPLLAGSLECRSAGFFASPDARVKLHREAWRHAPHLDVDGLMVMSLDGPILQPGYHVLTGGATTTQLDAVRRLLVETGAAGNTGATCRRAISEYQGGVLVRLEYDQAPSETTTAICRLIFPISANKGRRVRWDGHEMVLPADTPTDGRFVFLDDPAGQANRFRVALENGQELGIAFLTPTKERLLADCRQWQEMNYHLQARFAGKMLFMFLCLLRPDEPFPDVTLPAEAAVQPQATLSDQGAAFSAQKGRYDIRVSRSGQLSVMPRGVAGFSVDPPYVREKGALYALAKPVSLQAVGNRVDVVTQAKDLPLRAHQQISMDDDDWLSVTTQFEGVIPGTQSASLEVALPVAIFAGKTLRAGERFIPLPVEPTAAMLVNDWNGKVRDYALPADGGEQIGLICDQCSATTLNDYRKWRQPCYKISLMPRDGTVKYRIHLRAADPPAATAPGNLLRDGADFEVGPEGVHPFASYSWTEKMVKPGIAPAFDTTSAAHGAASLRLTASDPIKLGNPRGFAFVGAVFNRVRLERDRQYTVSAWLKADRPGVKAVLYCGETSWAGNDRGEIPVTTEWQRYAIPFYTNDFQKSGYYLTWVGLAPGVTEGTLWVDAVQLEEGGLTAFHAANAAFGVEALGEHKLFEQGTAAKAILRARNNGAAPLTGQVTYVIRDYWEHPVRTGAVALSVPAGTSAVYPVDLGVLPCGYYRGAFTVPGGEEKEIIFGVYQPQPLAPLPADWPLACHNDPSPLVRKLGFGAVRAFEVFDYAAIAPKAGTYDFARTDRMVQQARENGLAIMPILGDFRWPSYRQQPPIPDDARERVTEHVLNGQRVRVAWPTLNAWRAYVQALTSRYKGEITYWEVLNEPNLMMTPAEYLPYLKAAYEAAKADNPACKIVGVCATSDFAGKPGSFTDGVLKLGSANYFDILSVHLYQTNPPERTLDAGSDRLMQNWHALMRDTYGKEAPIWHTERSFIARRQAYSMRTVNVPVEYCDEPQFLIDDFKQKAEYLLRETLLDAVAGQGGRYFWFGLFDEENSFLTNRYFQPYGLHHSEFDLSPTPELIAANGLARVLTGRSHPVRQIVMDDATRICIFAGERGVVAALWNWQSGSRIALPVQNTEVTTYNFFGDPIMVTPDGHGVMSLDLESAPKYLVFPTLDSEECCRLITRARLVQ